MDAQQALIVRRDPGGQAHVVEPVPEYALVSLHALTSAELREWVVLGDDPTGDRLRVCDHQFVIVGWLGGHPGALVLHHLGAVQ